MLEIHTVHKKKLSRIMRYCSNTEDHIFFNMREPNGSIFIQLSSMIKNISW